MLFGLYYIPFNTEFYACGSKILGYDILAKKLLACPGEINKNWVSESGKYGFHMTVTDAVDIGEEAVLPVENKISEVLSCFSKNIDFSLSVDEIGFWPNDRAQLAIRLKPNENVKMLHNVLVGTIQSLGSGSLYSKVLAKQIADAKVKYLPDQVEKIKKFQAPYIFEHFKPHFTLLYPFSGDENERIGVELFIRNIFDSSTHFSIDKLSMVTKIESDDYFKIHKIFSL